MTWNPTNVASMKTKSIDQRSRAGIGGLYRESRVPRPQSRTSHPAPRNPAPRASYPARAPVILFVAIYGVQQTRAGAQARQRGNLDPRAARRTAAARLRDRAADRQPFRRSDQLSTHLALSDALPARGPRPDRRALGRTRRAAPPPLLQADPDGPQDAQSAARHMGRLLLGAESSRENYRSVNHELE